MNWFRDAATIPIRQWLWSGQMVSRTVEGAASCLRKFHDNQKIEGDVPSLSSCVDVEGECQTLSVLWYRERLLIAL